MHINEEHFNIEDISDENVRKKFELYYKIVNKYRQLFERKLFKAAQTLTGGELKKLAQNNEDQIKAVEKYFYNKIFNSNALPFSDDQSIRKIEEMNTDNNVQKNMQNSTSKKFDGESKSETASNKIPKSQEYILETLAEKSSKNDKAIRDALNGVVDDLRLKKQLVSLLNKVKNDTTKQKLVEILNGIEKREKLAHVVTEFLQKNALILDKESYKSLTNAENSDKISIDKLNLDFKNLEEKRKILKDLQYLKCMVEQAVDGIMDETGISKTESLESGNNVKEKVSSAEDAYLDGSVSKDDNKDDIVDNIYKEVSKNKKSTRKTSKEPTEEEKSSIKEKFEKHESENISESDMVLYLTDQCKELVVQVQELEEQLEISKKQCDKQKQLKEIAVKDKDSLQSEFDNYRRRTKEDGQKAKFEGICEALEKVIPIIDVLEQAINTMEDDRVKEGLVMLNRQVQDAFRSYGLEEIEALNMDFDPDLHNAVVNTQAESQDQVGKIVEVLRKGYRLGDKIIRHSAVKVAN